MKRNKRSYTQTMKMTLRGEKKRVGSGGGEKGKEDGEALHTENMAEQNTGKKNTLGKKKVFASLLETGVPQILCIQLLRT